MNAELQKEDITLDEAFGQVEAVLDRLEAEDTTLENSFQMYQEGMRLLKICNDNGVSFDFAEIKNATVDKNEENKFIEAVKKEFGFTAEPSYIGQVG